MQQLFSALRRLLCGGCRNKAQAFLFSEMASLRINGQLSEDHTAFFMCDVQEKFRGVIAYYDAVISVADKMVKTAKILNIPLIVTEQYPKGLGRTVSELDISHAYLVEEKTKFSMITPVVTQAMQEICKGAVKAIVLFGVEAHVCVEQTAAELLAHGMQVHVVADCTSSRSQEDRFLALHRMSQMGCYITTSETVIFKLLGDKNHPKFAEIRPLIKTPSPPTGLVNYSKMEVKDMIT
ncbi:isochorismatase domain-containing protein 1-like isoform X1 [Schistocerca nitens]|uniref:isochorismatase domain-containing protein 1-like isoform X1 n=1 Tax=Schistocerca nitens TaxID=7011 RepID=UPI002118C8BE|nr:isochorismatase domain-containing protein 1-like isoform X1 [Schistocerca nitens]